VRKVDKGNEEILMNFSGFFWVVKSTSLMMDGGWGIRVDF
jgi:hypothetical protein